VPEGPEIARAARAVHAAVAQQACEITLLHPKIKFKQRRLRGAHIVQVHARSKAMLTEFSTGDVLYSHNQLYGEWVVHDATDALKPKQVRLIIRTAHHQAVLYSATDFAWLKTGREHLHPYIAKLGPDVLDQRVTAQQIAAQLARFPRRIIADALLDQGVLAGLGNYLRADILFVAAVNPLMRIGKLTRTELLRIARACQQITQRSVRHDGVTRPFAHYRASRAQGLDYEAARFHVFDRAGQPCWHCDTPIRRSTQGGRGLFFCPVCQDCNL
jgi:endonuclease VIII